MDFAVAYWDRPDHIIWVDTPVRRLQGFDNYWIDGASYGMFQDPENMGVMYEGRQAVAWTFDGHTERELIPPPTPDSVWRGFMLTTEQAEFVGLL